MAGDAPSEPPLDPEMEALVVEALNRRLAADPNMALPEGFERAPSVQIAAHRSDAAAADQVYSAPNKNKNKK
eukprot:331036-Prorocentrum_minimum.AAC.1